MMDRETAWKTPDPDTALAFAFTEIGETVDAHLRIIGGYARNNERQPTVFEELADTGMMLISSLRPDHNYKNWIRPIKSAFVIDLKTIATEVLLAWTSMQEKHRIIRTQDALWWICHYEGMNFESELQKRMDRIEAKNRKVTP